MRPRSFDDTVPSLMGHDLSVHLRSRIDVHKAEQGKNKISCTKNESNFKTTHPPQFTENACLKVQSGTFDGHEWLWLAAVGVLSREPRIRYSGVPKVFGQRLVRKRHQITCRFIIIPVNLSSYYLLYL
jgi:hypothetical protein